MKKKIQIWQIRIFALKGLALGENCRRNSLTFCKFVFTRQVKIDRSSLPRLVVGFVVAANERAAAE